MSYVRSIYALYPEGGRVNNAVLVFLITIQKLVRTISANVKSFNLSRLSRFNLFYLPD